MNSYLVIVLTILVIIALVQYARVLELTNSLRGEDDIFVTDREINFQSTAMVVFILGYIGFFGFLMYKYGKYLLPEPASAHGVDIDMLMNINWVILIIAFLATHLVLAYLVYKYARTRHPQAVYMTHSNKLELLWTSIPASALAIIIVYGISTWNAITREEPENALNIELYARQFDWTARYAGADNILGKADFRMISGTNPLGVINNASLSARIVELETKIADLEATRAQVYPGGKSDLDLLDQIAGVRKQQDALKQLQEVGKTQDFSTADDDILTKVEFHIPVNQPIMFKIRAQEVIHSVYMPHFRAQMNAVPGLVTQFYFTPTITTTEMRQKLNNPEFDYLLLCNKICGSAHYNMQMKVVVDTDEDYKKWIAEQPKFAASLNL
jgi:cytochrome c oxidase subunit 2